MQICTKHWDMCWDAVTEIGMAGLVAADAETAFATMMQSDIADDPSSFDPMMSLHWHFTNRALEQGGLYLMGIDPDGHQYCPICEFEQHADGFVAKEAIEDVTGQMATWARSRSLIPPVN